MPREQRRLAAIVAADVVGFSVLMGRDEVGTLANLKAHRGERLEPALARNGGRLVKLTGDGVLAEFASAVDALNAAIEFQQSMAEATQGQPDDTRMVFRIGLHLGDLIVDGDDLYGDGVNVATRLESKAPAGGIVISGNVYDAVAGRLKATFDNMGNLVLKNIERPVQAFGVKWQPADWSPVETSVRLSDLLQKFNVDSVRIENVFLGPEALAPDRIVGRYFSNYFQYPEHLEREYRLKVKRIEQNAEQSGQTFDNNGTYSLRRMTVRRPEAALGGRENIFRFDFYKSDYSRFVVPNSVLDSVLIDPTTNTALSWREATGLFQETLRFSKLEEFPFHFRVGVNGIFITKDNYAVVSFRSKLQLIAGASELPDELIIHSSVAEGMFRSDVDDTKSDVLFGGPHPFATLMRAAGRELGLQQRDFVADSCRCIAFAMDRLRAQPLFVFCATLGITIGEVIVKSEEAADKHENEFVGGVAWNKNTLNKLFGSTHISEIEGLYPLDLARLAQTGVGPRVMLASNHAQFSFLAAYCHSFGERSEQLPSSFHPIGTTSLAVSHNAARDWAETWDRRVHGVERQLRSLIDVLLENNVQLMPPHILKKINSRLAAEAKNAAFDHANYANLVGKLEFCDLRDLQETILNKSLWPRFKSLFVNQDALLKKFDQLCNARNPIRHSRTLDEITEKEGEAAILWFEKVLQRGSARA